MQCSVANFAKRVADFDCASHKRVVDGLQVMAEPGPAVGPTTPRISCSIVAIVFASLHSFAFPAIVTTRTVWDSPPFQHPALHAQNSCAANENRLKVLSLGAICVTTSSLCSVLLTCIQHLPWIIHTAHKHTVAARSSRHPMHIRPRVTHPRLCCASARSSAVCDERGWLDAARAAVILSTCGSVAALFHLKIA